MFGKNPNDYLTPDEIIQRNKKISESKKGKPSKSGLKLTGRTKEQFDYLKQMGEKQSLKYKNENNPNAKRIVLNGIEYLTMKDASLKTGLSMYKLRKMI
jgi:phosphopantothenate synthetase